MRFLAALLGAVFICGTASAAEEGLCSSPKQMQGFKTCADIEKAEQEGEVVIYATSPELYSFEATKLVVWHSKTSCRASSSSAS